MTETAKAITEYGVLIVIAAAFLWLVLRNVKSHEKAVEGFTEAAKSFNQEVVSFRSTVDNHLEHETQAFAEMTKAIERLCFYIEKDGQHDYRKRDD